VNSTLNLTQKTDIARLAKRIVKATWTEPNVFYFCEPRQCANKGNPFKVNVNAFSRTFACEWFPQIFLNLNFNSRFGKHSFSVNSFISFFPSTSCIFVFTIATIFACDSTSAIPLHAQVQFHAKYPLFDTQTDRGFTFSDAILYNIPLADFVLKYCDFEELLLYQGAVFVYLFFFFGHQIGYTYNNDYQLTYLANRKFQFLVSGFYKQPSNEKQSHCKDIIWLSIKNWQLLPLMRYLVVGS